MTSALLYSMTGIVIFCIGLRGLVLYTHLMRRVLALNIMSTGIFMFLVALAHRHPDGEPDPIPHAMVLTGIVVSISATAFILALIVRLHAATGHVVLEKIISHDEEREE